MTKKEYNLEPKDLEEAKETIKKVIQERDEIIAERDQKDEAWQKLSKEVNASKRQSLNLNDPFNSQITEQEIIDQAKSLGMKTEEEFQTALQAEKDKLKSGNYSWWWLLIIPIVLVLIWIVNWLRSKTRF